MVAYTYLVLLENKKNRDHGHGFSLVEVLLCP